MIEAWLGARMGNANFFYVSNSLVCVGQVAIVYDIAAAAVRRRSLRVRHTDTTLHVDI